MTSPEEVGDLKNYVFGRAQRNEDVKVLSDVKNSLRSSL